MKFPKSILIALIGLVAAIVFVVNNQRQEPRPQPVRAPAPRMFQNRVAGTGIIEARQENIAVAPYRTGRVTRIAVREGQQVAAGDTLYTLDDAEVRAQLATAQAALATQRAQLATLRAQPRPETLPALQATLQQAEASLQEARLNLSRIQALSDPRAVSRDEVTRRQSAVQVAAAQVANARAQLNLQRAGAWRFDIQRAQADVASAEAQVQQQAVLVAQSVVRAPRAGEVLRINIRPGESVSATPTAPPMVLGNTRQLQVRVDIDEINASRIRPGMPAVAVLRGDSTKRIPLRFDRIIPFMVPKTNLTGSNTERVDVRVLQVIYGFTPPDFPVYVGQQVDVYLDANP